MKLLTSSAKMLNALSRINIYDSFDLIETLPYRYEDYSYSDEEEKWNDKEKITLLIRLVSNPTLTRVKKLDIIKFYGVSLKSKRMYHAVIFNRSFYAKTLNLKDEYTLQGVWNERKKEIHVISIYNGELEENKRLKPIYHLPQDISQNGFRKLLEKTLKEVEPIYSYDIPLFFQNKYHLLKHLEALRKIHFPTTEEDIKKGIRTLKYGECLEFSLRNALIREENRKEVRGKKKIDNLLKINEFIKGLPYKLSKDQIKAIREVILDMNKDALMYRLLEGDVGTGKTIVAITALYGNYLRHQVGTFMVPTDTLARQQYQDVKDLFEPYGIRVELLIGSLTMKEKKDLKERLINGEIDVLIGTHALFSTDVIYPNLGLCIIDEQHRFGVNQRSQLVSKGELADLLLMSATPIPRTLSIALYGDLDVSTLSTYPREKSIVKTFVVDSKSHLIFQSIDDALEHNRQVFIVAPKIEDNKSLYNVEKLYEFYKSLYKDEVIALTGKMKSLEKEEKLELFKQKKKKILIATTVIELGLNVMSAEVMIIYGASYFGLATLHQLRGRVGRDGSEAICLLIDEEEKERLKLLENIYDGATLSYEDLKLRGGGDYFGSRQSGFSSFHVVNVIDDFKMFSYAREDAYYILNHLSEESFERFVLRVKERMSRDEKILLIES